jgi:hypothetical protein
MLNVVKHPSLLIEDKQHQIPLPPGRSKLWSAVRMRERDDIVGLRRFLFLLVFGFGFDCVLGAMVDRFSKPGKR